MADLVEDKAIIKKELKQPLMDNFGHLVVNTNAAGQRLLPLAYRGVISPEEVINLGIEEDLEGTNYFNSDNIKPFVDAFIHNTIADKSFAVILSKPSVNCSARNRAITYYR